MVENKSPANRINFDWAAALDDWLTAPYKFGHILGFEKLTHEHDVWINYFLRVPKGGVEVLQAHRNSYKTTCGLVALVLLFLIYPELRVLVVRKNDTLAAKVAIALQKIFASNGVVRAFVYARFGLESAVTKEWSEAKTVFAFKRRVTIEPSLTIAGIKGSITGAHFDYIWSDDIVAREDSESDAEREATKNFVHELINLVEPTGSRMFTGTPWHEEDAFSILKATTGEPIKRFPIRSIQIPDIDEAWIEREQKSMPVWKWAANYELQHVADTETIGAIPFIPTFTAKYFVAFIDPSFSDKKNSDRCSVAVVGFDFNPATKETQIQATGKCWEKSISHPDVRRELIQFLDIYKPIETQLESQLSDSTVQFIEPFKIEEKRLGVSVENYWSWKHQHGDKHTRIQTHVHSNKFRLVLLEGTDPIFVRFVTGYHKAARVKDPADSLAGAIELFQTSEVLQDFIRAAGMVDSLLKRARR